MIRKIEFREVYRDIGLIWFYQELMGFLRRKIDGFSINGGSLGIGESSFGFIGEIIGRVWEILVSIDHSGY